MKATKYELLKCDDCGKTLGYMYETVKMWPPRIYLRHFTGFYQKIKRYVFCEECFHKRKAEIATKTTTA